MGMFLTFSKNPRWYTEKKGNQDPKICILVICIIYIDCDIGDLYISISYMCIFRLGVYEVYYLYISLLGVG